MRTQRNSLNWPLARLASYAEENREDADILMEIRSAARHRGTPEAEDLALRVQGMLAAIGAFDALDAEEAGDGIEALTQKIRDLEDRLRVAERRAREAEARATEAERRAPAVRIRSDTLRDGGNETHERVHLMPTAPSWLVDAAQRAFRQRYHPDRYFDQSAKSQAEAVFKEAEVVFSELRRSDDSILRN